MSPEIGSESQADVQLQTFREAVESAGHAIYWTDPSGTIEHVNPAFEEQTGFSAEEAIGSNASILQSGVHDDVFYEELWDTILSGEVWRGEIINETRSNERYVAKQTISPITNNAGDIVRFVAVNEDITELRDYQQQLERERDRFEELLDAVPVPLVLTGFDGCEPIVRETNQSFRTQFGFSEQQLLESPLDEFIVDDANTEQARAINEQIRHGERVTQEVSRRTADGRERTFLLVATPLAGGDRDESLAAYIDITDQKRTEEQLRRKNEQLTEFADVISHDLRNPLSVAIGRLELVSEEFESDDLDRVREAHARMKELIENVLNLAKHGQTIDEPEPVELAETVSRCWNTISTSDAVLNVEIAADRTILADENRLRQLFSNLFRNAVEHAAPDVTITIGELPGGFHVSDDGPGIPESERDRIFDSGYTTVESGTGFGLSIVQEIASAHGWSVAVTESEGGGARFEFTGVESGPDSGSGS
jgi:PAS domain S-box-containing protein